MVALASGALYAGTLDSLPFHPDESSWIYMSRDFDSLIHLRMGNLVWWLGERPNGDVGFRLLDAPLAKYQIGLSRLVSGHSAEPLVNWDWLHSWDTNIADGAMPPAALLRAARLSAVVTAALSLALFFVIASEVFGPVAATVATVLMAVHPLELLHIRRAMAESIAQLFTVATIAAILWLIRVPRDKRVLASGRSAAVGIAMGLAVAAKQNAIAIAPLAVMAAVAVAIGLPATIRLRLNAAASNATVLIASSVLTFFLLNPVLYSQPIHAGRMMISVRRSLAGSQAASRTVVESGTALPSTLMRLNAAYEQMFWSSPDTGESATYPELAPHAEAYGQSPLTRVWNSMAVRLLILALTAIGFAAVVAQITRARLSSFTWPLQVMILWLVAEAIFVLVFIPLDWQRYFLPLLPPVCLFAGRGMSWLVERTGSLRRSVHE
jgi:hypothetical protein